MRTLLIGSAALAMVTIVAAGCTHERTVVRHETIETVPATAPAVVERSTVETVPGSASDAPLVVEKKRTTVEAVPAAPTIEHRTTTTTTEE